MDVVVEKRVGERLDAGKARNALQNAEQGALVGIGFEKEPCAGGFEDDVVVASAGSEESRRSHGGLSLVLVVDALAARECDHLFSSLQLSDAGIEPGSGVGNHRTALTKDTLGLPVLSLGIPTVVNSATLVREALSKGGVEESDMILALLSNQKSFFVSPKDSDFLVEQAATLISRAIRRAFTPGL